MTCELKIRLHASYATEYYISNIWTPRPLFHVPIMTTVKKSTLSKYCNVNELADRPEILHSSGAGRKVYEQDKTNCLVFVRHKNTPFVSSPI
jgi:hypothetical protein